MRRTAPSSPRLLAVALGVFLMGLGCAGGTEPAPPEPGAAEPAEAVEAPWANQVEADATALFQICLLYTSPSPRDQRGSRMPSSA